MWIKPDHEYEAIATWEGLNKQHLLSERMNVSHIPPSGSPRAGTDSLSAWELLRMGVQLWACFLETDLQNPKKAQHLGWFIPLVGVECGRSQSRNPQGKKERAFPFHLARRCGQGQGPALRPLLSLGKRTCRPQKLYELRECPPGEASGITHFSSGCNHPSHTPGTARL